MAEPEQSRAAEQLCKAKRTASRLEWAARQEQTGAPPSPPTPPSPPPSPGLLCPSSTRSRVDRGMGARAKAARKAGRTCFLRCVLRCFLRLEHQGATALSQGCSLPHLAEVKCLVHVMKRMCHGTRSKQGRGRGSRQSITRKEQPAAHDPSCRRWACDRRSHD